MTMAEHSKGKWVVRDKTLIVTGKGVQVCDVSASSCTDFENEANAKRIAACVNACDGYTTEQLLALAGGNVKREVTHFADKLCEAESRYLKAEAHRESLLVALKALLEFEGVEAGEMDDDQRQYVRIKAQQAVSDVEAATRRRILS